MSLIAIIVRKRKETKIPQLRINQNWNKRLSQTKRIIPLRIKTKQRWHFLSFYLQKILQTNTHTHKRHLLLFILMTDFCPAKSKMGIFSEKVTVASPQSHTHHTSKKHSTVTHSHWISIKSREEEAKKTLN